uniref:Inositol-pentakisphosphate 2-kinase n=1 Tax=Rhizophora mucronata TaxID=61149 RepID=A0A2P2MT07_RHIMU
MEVKLKEKDAADWVYRGEGAANIVLAYAGSSPAFIGKVMRIQKVERNGSSGSGCGARDQLSELTEKEKLLWRETKEIVSSPDREMAKQLYAKHVISPLLGPTHVDAGV